MDKNLSDTERKLIKGCKKGKSAAQEQLYKLYYRYVLSIALRYTKERYEAEEILNESFFKILTKIDLFDSKKSFKGWIRQITVHTSIDYYRKNKQIREEFSLDEISKTEYDLTIIEKLTAEEILKLLQQLPEHYRLVFNLFEIEGYSHQEISEMLQIPMGTSRSHLTRARYKLRKMVIALYGEFYERVV